MFSLLDKVFRKYIYYIASVIFIAVGIVYFIACLQQSFIGLEIENIKGQWIVTTSNTYGEGAQLGIQVGDEILKINNEDTGKYLYIQKWGEAEGASTIEFRRAGQITNSIITIQKQPVSLRIFSDIPLYILGFIFWFLGFITWFKRSFLIQARTLFWLNWLIALAFVLVNASSRDLLFGKELECITFSLVPVFLIRLISVFPINNKNSINRVGCKVSIFIFLMVLSLIVIQLFDMFHLVSLIRKLMLSNMIIGIIFVLWNLSRLIKLPKDKPERNQAGILLFGMAAGFLPIMLLTAIPIIFNHQQLAYFQISSLFVAVIPVSLYYVIVNKYLPDSRRLLKTIMSSFIAGVISFILTYLIFFLQMKNLNFENYLTLLFSTLLFIVCFSIMRIVITKLLERNNLFNFKQRITEPNDNLNSLVAEDRILEDLIKSLGIEGAFIIVENAQIGCMRKAVGRFQVKQNEQTELEDFFHNDQRLEMEPRILPDDFPAAIYIPFVSHDSTCGIFFGHRTSRIKFVQSELAFLTLLAGQLTHQLIMSFIINKLTGENDVLTNIINKLTKEIKFLTENYRGSHRRIVELQSITNSLVRNLERERKLIFREIYDGPLHSGLDLSRWIKYLKEESLSDDRKQKIINHIQDLAEDVKHELCLIADELHPPTLADLGLLTAIELLCQEIMLKEQSLISLKTSGISSEDRFKEEVEITAYRFIQEGIMNSIQHSGSNRQRVYIELTESRLELAVSDSGRGFDVRQIEEWLLKGTHFGIVGMKERIESLGGELEINSAIHKGTTIKATITILSLV
jgi:two-component system sensor histidine kinase ComP